MQNSQTSRLTWSLHTRGNNNLWPQLCQENQGKHSARKKEATRENTETVELDDSEYPELGSAGTRSRKSLGADKGSDIQVLIPTQMIMESKRSKRYKRPEKICINLQEVLQNTRCMNKVKKKGIAKLRINIGKRNSGVTDISNSSFRKVKICISRNKKPSKLKKIILLHRHIKAQNNVKRREAFENEKMAAICKDVNDINFHNLKITADPAIDVDGVQGMSAMTLYGKDYRNTMEGNIPEDPVYFRSDVIEKMNNLQIQRQCTATKLAGNCFSESVCKMENKLDNDIVKQTLSLDINDDVKQEFGTKIKLENSDSIVHSCNFREYCTNTLTSSLNSSLEKFLGEITRLQKRCYDKCPNKSKYKQRYYCGLKEVQKHAELKRLKFVIIAPDLERVELSGGLDDAVEKLLETCRKQRIVYCFGLRRRKLGYYTHGRGHVACVGISNYTGTEELFKDVLTEVVHARDEFKNLTGSAGICIDVSKLLAEDYLPSESVKTLLTVLSPAL